MENKKETPQQTWERLIKEKVVRTTKGGNYSDGSLMHCELYHTERLRIESEQPKLDFEQCLRQVIYEVPFESVSKAVDYCFEKQDREMFFNMMGDVAELYASQFQAVIAEKDKEIREYKDMVLNEGKEFRATAKELRENYNEKLDELQKEHEQLNATIEEQKKEIASLIKRVG